MKNNSDQSNSLLIVFVKNPILGNVKKRLSLTIGYKNALEIYNDLVYKTHNVIKLLPFNKQVSYSDFIEENDIWETNIFGKSQQAGKNIGERMFNAFSNAFEQGYENVVLIGSDTINLTPEVINTALNQLQQSDLVLGPAKDGGYYLIGLNKPIKQIFENKEWSTNKVLIQTLKDCYEMDLKLKLVRELADLDRFEDFRFLDQSDWEKYMELIEKDASKLTHPYLFHFIKKGA